MPTILKRCLAELVGALNLVYLGSGAAAITLMISRGSTPPNPFNIGIYSLGGFGGWLAIGIAFALVISTSIYTLGGI